MNFSFFNIEIIHGVTLTFVDICSATQHPFAVKVRRKRTPIGIFKFLFTKSRNKYTKVFLIRVDEYESLEIASKFMQTCHKMNTIVQTTGGY